jgi:hypothetical protein
MFLLTSGVSSALFQAALMWVFYIALEPFARRHWPQTLIGWSRVLAGSYRDALVGRDLLAGSVAGVLAALLVSARYLADMQAGAAPPSFFPLEGMMGGLFAAGFPIYGIIQLLRGALGGFLFLFILRLVLRKVWLAGVAFIVVSTIVQLLQQSGNMALDIALGCAMNGILLVVYLRWGLLAAAAAFWAEGTLAFSITTSDFSTWYASGTIYGLLQVLVVATYGFHTTLAGRPLFQSELLRE